MGNGQRAVDGMISPPLPEADLLSVLQGAGGVWEELRGRRIFITGATGFVGRWMLESLLAADTALGLDIRVTAHSRDPVRFLGTAPHFASCSALNWMRGSVATLEPVNLEGRQFDYVIHLATEADLEVTRADPAAAIEVIAGGTRRVLEIASQSGARRILFTSSGSVYGPQPEGLAFLYEDRPLPAAIPAESDAGAIGADAKRQAERACAEFVRDRGLDAVIARCFTFAGPAMPLDGKFAFGNFMRDALAGRRIVVTGDGTPVRSYMYGADLAAWLWTILVQGSAGAIYNVGSEHAIRLQDLAELIGDELGAPGVEVRTPTMHGNPVNRYIPSTLKARKELGLRETISLTESVRKTADWLHH